MPTVDIQENIKQIRESISKHSHEVAKLHGVLQTFEGFHKSGLKVIDLPIDPTNQEDNEDLANIQEKPE
jgi:hypothetical protein